jgi:hypothetical protein
MAGIIMRGIVPKFPEAQQLMMRPRSCEGGLVMTITIQPSNEPIMNVSRTLTGINHILTKLSYVTLSAKRLPISEGLNT